MMSISLKESHLQKHTYHDNKLQRQRTSFSNCGSFVSLSLSLQVIYSIHQQLITLALYFGHYFYYSFTCTHCTLRILLLSRAPTTLTCQSRVLADLRVIIHNSRVNKEMTPAKRRRGAKPPLIHVNKSKSPQATRAIPAIRRINII